MDTRSAETIYKQLKIHLMKTLKVLSIIFVCIIATTSLQAQTVVKSNKNKKLL